VPLPWDAAKLILGLGDRQFSDMGRARLRALRPEIDAVARETGLPPALLAGIAFVESEGDPEARGPELPSGDRAVGLMQVIPSNLRALGVPEGQWTDPETNLRAGAHVLIAAPEPFGEVEPGKTLAAYGGFRDTDPTSYIQDVQTMALRARRELGYSLFPGDAIRLPEL
jgi:soluble lytic murein transglycosylase-like protein